MPGVLRWFFEWGGGCLWPGDDAARAALGLGPYDTEEPCPLPLSEAVRAECARLGEWHDRSLNWAYPPDPGPWRQDECDRFNAAAEALLRCLRHELEPRWMVVDRQPRLYEDPDLDEYLRDPAGFRFRAPPRG